MQNTTFTFTLTFIKALERHLPNVRCFVNVGKTPVLITSLLGLITVNNLAIAGNVQQAHVHGVAELTVAFEKVWNSAEFQDFMKGRGFGLVWKPGDEFSEWMSSSDEALGEVMKAVGLAK